MPSNGSVITNQQTGNMIGIGNTWELNLPNNSDTSLGATAKPNPNGITISAPDGKFIGKEAEGIFFFLKVCYLHCG